MTVFLWKQIVTIDLTRGAAGGIARGGVDAAPMVSAAAGVPLVFAANRVVLNCRDARPDGIGRFLGSQ